jgi:hypothetical protein
MTLVSLDIVLALPEHLRMQAVFCSKLVSGKMSAGGSGSHFRLGEPFPGRGGGCCEPHVSLFMLAVDELEVNEVARVAGQLAATLPAPDAEAFEYRHNPYGAVEVYFRKSGEWSAIQRAVIESVEPLRRGRLRELDPSGTRISDILGNTARDDPGRQQLVRYGYDEVADQEHDRFNPHVTLAWPHRQDYRVALDGLPAPRSFSGRLTELAVFGVSGYGTCTTNYGVFPVGAVRPAVPSMASGSGQLGGP